MLVSDPSQLSDTTRTKHAAAEDRARHGEGHGRILPASILRRKP